MSFANQIKTWRADRTQREAAAVLGVPLRTYQDWEQARRTPQGFARRAIETIINPNKTTAVKKSVRRARRSE